MGTADKGTSRLSKCPSIGTIFERHVGRLLEDARIAIPNGGGLEGLLRSNSHVHHLATFPHGGRDSQLPQAVVSASEAFKGHYLGVVLSDSQRLLTEVGPTDRTVLCYFSCYWLGR